MDLQRRHLLRGKLSPQRTALHLPWLTSIASFHSRCTRCAECQEACPEHIIIKGDGGFPEIDFKKGGCVFCEKCAQACPELLFTVDANSIPWDYMASINQHCLTYHGVSCQSCQDSCDFHAIKFAYQLGAVAQPRLNEQQCTGCGACVSVCPVSAINVQSKQQ